MSRRPRVRVPGIVLLALAGLAVAVALSVAASNLSSEPIGLTAEPLRVGETLAPPVADDVGTTAKRAVRERTRELQKRALERAKHEQEKALERQHEQDPDDD